MIWELDYRRRRQGHDLFCSLGDVMVVFSTFRRRADLWLYLRENGVDTVLLHHHYYQRPPDARAALKAIHGTWPAFLDERPAIADRIMERLL